MRGAGAGGQGAEGRGLREEDPRAGPRASRAPCTAEIAARGVWGGEKDVATLESQIESAAWGGGEGRLPTIFNILGRWMTLRRFGTSYPGSYTCV